MCLRAAVGSRSIIPAILLNKTGNNRKMVLDAETYLNSIPAMTLSYGPGCFSYLSKFVCVCSKAARFLFERYLLGTRLRYIEMRNIGLLISARIPCGIFQAVPKKTRTKLIPQLFLAVSHLIKRNARLFVLFLNILQIFNVNFKIASDAFNKIPSGINSNSV